MSATTSRPRRLAALAVTCLVASYLVGFTGLFLGLLLLNDAVLRLVLAAPVFCAAAAWLAWANLARARTPERPNPSGALALLALTAVHLAGSLLLTAGFLFS